MEKEELMVCENQIGFDFDLLEETEEEEKSTILPEGFVISKNHDYVDEEVLFVVAKAENSLGKAYERELCGKSVIEWVRIAGGGCEQMEIADNGNLIEVIKSIKTDKKYIAIFYADTPLVSKGLFHKIMDYFCKNGMNALALPRGYVFKKDYIVTMDRLVSTCPMDFDELAFTVVDNTKNIAKISKLLYDKIRAYHIRNGVIMYGNATIFIDADVEIEPGAVIYQNNILRGQSYIGKNAVLEPNNIISDSIIADNSVVISSYIEKSKVTTGKSVGPFEKLIGSEK